MTESPGGSLPEMLSLELTACRQRGIERLDVRTHNQSPVPRPALQQLADEYQSVTGRRTTNRIEQLKYLLRDTIHAFGTENVADAQLVAALFFGDSQDRVTKSAGELLDLALRKSGFEMARSATLASIENPRGYFYRTMVNTWRHLGQELARHGWPTDDPDTAAGPSPSMPSAECTALTRLDAAARRGRLRHRRAELWLTIPAYSADPYRYREVILATAEEAAAGDGPVSRTELNEVLVAA